jgi:yersiniabactin nonribosomal peptide synthetase
VGYVLLDREEGSDLFETEQADSAICDSRWQAILSNGQQQASQMPDSEGNKGISIFMDYAEDLSFAFICNTLYNMGIFSQEGEQYSIDEMISRFKIHPRYRTLILHWLNVLTDEGLLERCEETDMYISRRPLGEEFPKLTENNGLKISPHILKEALELEAFFTRGGPVLMGLLKGEFDPLELFLTEDSFFTPEYLGRFNLSREYYINLSRKVFESIINSYSRDKEVHVLEIGTRAGGLMGALAPLMLPDRGRYLYADESSFFTDKAKRKAGERAPLEYGLFDMNLTPTQQGYELHSFDVIVADNTLHRTRNIEMTLEYLKEMLVPGGLLFFTESTDNNRLMLTTVGFFEDGFSHLEDERKTDNLPLITAEKWREVLEKKGFAKVMVFPGQENAEEILGQHLIVAQAPETVKVFSPSNLSDIMRRRLPDYMVPTSYVLLKQLPLSENGKIDRKALAKLGRGKGNSPKKTHVQPTTEAQIKIASVWKEVLNCNELGIHDGFFELGGDSLRAIQCINLLKERYHMELSLHNLFEAPTVDLLAKVMEECEEKKEQPSVHYEEGRI